MKVSNIVVDANKRRTLKRLAGTAGASAALVSLPTFANLVETQQADTSNNAIAIEAILVSIPGTDNETLILKNVSDQPIRISQFVDARVSFDDEIIDCGSVCKNNTIDIPANMDVMLQFNSDSSASHPNALSKPHNVQAMVNLLPEGTRVIPLKASISGSVATLLHT